MIPTLPSTSNARDSSDLVQDVLLRNSGRSDALQARPERKYLLKGIILCACCGMPMWAQTCKNGQRYYREYKGSGSPDVCEGAGDSIPCHVADEAGRLVQDPPRLWAEATLQERRRLLMTMLDAVYVDAKDQKRMVAVRPKLAFRPILQVATTRERSEIELPTGEPPEESSTYPPMRPHLSPHA
jgi:hypothetical protein